MYVTFHISPGLLLPKVGVQQHSYLLQEDQHLSHSIRVTITHPLSSVKTIKKPDVDKKTEACVALTLTEGFLFFSCRSSKQSVSRLLTLNWSEYLNTGQNT